MYGGIDLFIEYFTEAPPDTNIAIGNQCKVVASHHFFLFLVVALIIGFFKFNDPVLVVHICVRLKVRLQ